MGCVSEHRASKKKSVIVWLGKLSYSVLKGGKQGIPGILEQLFLSLGMNCLLWLNHEKAFWFESLLRSLDMATLL